MASAFTTFSGSEGPKFRATVDMTRSYVGTAAQNYETWTITGYVDKTSTSGLDVTYSRPDAYYYLGSGTFQTGEDASGNVAISWANTVGRKFTTSINNMTIERFQDGTALSATAEFYFYAGFVGVTEADVTVGWSTNDVPRAATITTATMNFYETEDPTITFTTPVPSFPVDVLLQLNDNPTYTNVTTRTSITSPYTIVLTAPERDAIRAAIPNSSTVTFTYYLKTNDGSPFGVTKSYNGGNITIDNRGNIAAPTFTTWGVTDTTSAVAATSGGNPVMVQGKSVARATVTTANKGVGIKSATMSSYNVSIGSYIGSMAYSGVADVTKDVSFATDVPSLTAGTQTMSVAAVDSRGYSTAVNKSILVLPYSNPLFYPTIKIGYTNRFDVTGGMSVTLPGGTNLLSFSPLNFSSTDYNVINSYNSGNGVQYQLHKNTINSGNPWNNITTSTVTGSGVQTATAATLATSILSTMNGMGADNSVTWYVMFRVFDKYNSVTPITATYTIDIGAPIFRIGVDGNVYNNEKRILTVGDYTPDGWTTMVTNPDVITALGQHSFTVRYPNVDYTDRLAKGMRLLLKRGTATPTVVANFNGTSQYFSRASGSVNGMTFTDDFVCEAWVKLASYGSADMVVMSRSDSTNGWWFGINPQGNVVLNGHNGAAGNFRRVVSYPQVPLNKWVHISALLDMSANTAAAATAETAKSWTMIDGIETPAVMVVAGTSPTALVQAGPLNIGALNGGNFFPGRIGQVAVYSTRVTQAIIRDSMNQTLTGSETSLISAYTLSSSVTDLKTGNANTLTVNGGVAAVSDPPFALGSDALGTLGVSEYGIITNVSYSSPNTTLTVQTPTGSVLPVTGSISASYYSIQRAPYGFPSQANKWRITTANNNNQQVSIGAINQFYQASGFGITVPVGEWKLGFMGAIHFDSTVSGQRSYWAALSDVTPTMTTGVVNPNYPLMHRGYFGGSSTNVAITSANVWNYVTLTTQTKYFMYGAIDVSTGTESWYVRGDQNTFMMYAENAYL